MLKTRILTTLFILPVMLFALFWASNYFWAAFTGFMTILACWEWTRFLKFSIKNQILTSIISSVFAALLWYFVPKESHPIWAWSVLIFWLGLIPLWLRFRWRLPKNLFGMLIGWGMLFSFWWAFLLWRPDVLNVWRLLALMIVVWLADSAAYFAGRRFGKHKLAPKISPGKTWEGVAGAMLITGIYGILLGQTKVYPIHLSWWQWLFLTWILVAVSIMGDLIESLFKRQADLKDSSQLLPGHGGILDRVDSLIAVLPVALAFFYLLS